jgi:hypothetical protein
MLTEGGVSNYGTHLLTIVPYTLAFLFCALFTAQAGQLLPRSPGPVRTVKRSLYVLAILLCFIPVSTYPYRINHFWAQIHDRIFMVLVGFELLLAIYLVVKIYRNWSTYLTLAIQISGAILLALNLGGLHVLFIAQQVAGAGFGLLLITAATALPGGLAERQ